MDEYIFRKKFERAEENQLGINTSVINRIIKFVNSSKKCQNEDIRFFIDNLDKIDLSYDVFNIAETDEKEGFMYQGQRLHLKESSSDIIIGHELGHVLNGLKNVKFADPFIDPLNSLKYKIILPTNFVEIMNKAKENCLLPENRESFKAFVEHICKDNNIAEAESEPVSDILSAVFESPALRIRTYENICFFPHYHKVFFDADKKIEDRNQSRFDECFANIFSLVANNCEDELNVLTSFLGEEFMGLFLDEIHKAVQVFRSDIEPKPPEATKNVEKLDDLDDYCQ